MVIFKPTARIRRLTPALKTILDVLYTVDGSTPWLPLELVVASINDGQHMTGSRHYTDEALDLRSHNFHTPADRVAFRELLAERLGPAFTVLLEDAGRPNEHFHLQPKKGTTYP